MHAVHHSDTELNFLSWSRGHALEQSFIAIGVLLGSSWLKYIIASPQYHRWHHAEKEEAWDKNFASIFPFLDVLWGTYYYPHSDFGQARFGG